jgi:hypothetical protein
MGGDFEAASLFKLQLQTLALRDADASNLGDALEFFLYGTCRRGRLFAGSLVRKIVHGNGGRAPAEVKYN